MNTAVHTNTRVHCCRDDVLGAQALVSPFQEVMMMPLTLSLPQVLADAERDPCRQQRPVTFDFMVPPE
jgi:hypothetical protein